jgi:DNA mismatch repair protein MutS2
MNSQAFTTLEYQQLLELITRGAQTEVGRRRVVTLTPLDHIADLRRELTALSECVALKNRGINWSFSEFADPAETIGRLRIAGNALDSIAILETSKLCEQALSARASILAEREAAPVLWQLVEALPRDLNTLVARVANKILPSGELDDRASPELGRIRHDIATLRSRITRSLESLMRKSADSIQDELVTIQRPFCNSSES